jgi:hypothetical protein
VRPGDAARGEDGDGTWAILHAAAALVAAGDDALGAAELLGAADAAATSDRDAADVEGAARYEHLLKHAAETVEAAAWRAAYEHGRVLPRLEALRLVAEGKDPSGAA